MTAQIIDGRACARALRDELAGELRRAWTEGIDVGLAVVSVGAEYSSVAYEQRVGRLAAELEVPYQHTNLADTATQAELIAVIELLNADPAVSGILVLRPLPDSIDEAIGLPGDRPPQGHRSGPPGERRAARPRRATLRPVDRCLGLPPARHLAGWPTARTGPTSTIGR